jgi:hypothetical protein
VRLRQRYMLGAIMFGSRKPLAVRLSGCPAVGSRAGTRVPGSGLSDNGWAWSSCGEVGGGESDSPRWRPGTSWASEAEEASVLW